MGEQDLRALQAPPLELVIVQAHEAALARGGRSLLQRHFLGPLAELEPFHSQRDRAAADHDRSPPPGNGGQIVAEACELLPVQRRGARLPACSG